jgi:hypothetical protein
MSRKRKREEVHNEQANKRPHIDRESCGICLDDITDQGKINSCEHQFCFTCIKTWSDTSNTCPMCRERFVRIDHNDEHVDVEERNMRTPDEEIPEEILAQLNQYHHIVLNLLLIQTINHMIETYNIPFMIISDVPIESLEEDPEDESQS